MNYEKIYKNLYKKAKNREEILNETIERHHFIPRSLLNTHYKNKIANILDITEEVTDEINVIPLTLREHFFAHLLLFKIFPDTQSIMFGLNQVMNRLKVSRKYETFRKKVYIRLKELNTGMVNCLDKNTRKSFFVSSKEFKNNENLVGANYFSDCNKIVFTCEKCGKEIKGKANFYMHNKHFCEFGEKEPLIYTKGKCKFCGREMNKNLLSDHEKSCHENPNESHRHNKMSKYKCKFCGKEGSKNGIRIHEKYHCEKNINRVDIKKPKTVQCEFCGKFFSAKGMGSHLRKCKKERGISL